MTDWLLDWLIDWLIDWLTDWETECFQCVSIFERFFNVNASILKALLSLAEHSNQSPYEKETKKSKKEKT